MKSTCFLIILIFFSLTGCKKDDSSGILSIPDEVPLLSESTFSNPTVITNPFYGPPANKTYIYAAGETGMPPNEAIRIERRVTTKLVLDITCIIHHDLVFTNDNTLIEDTDDWLAHDDAGNLWYMGEFVKNYDDNGDFLDNDGSWKAGVNDALPGYWLPGNPVVGMVYYQEYEVGEAEDQAKILEIDATVTIALGTYTACLVTEDINPFEPEIIELKYYAPGIGFIKEEKFEDGELVEYVELIEIID